ncbi:MAG: hypothetical protein QOH80_1498 [Actinomycetota bacterium]|nr:hypothetical protein [Actinomycetota bacterium]
MTGHAGGRSSGIDRMAWWLRWSARPLAAVAVAVAVLVVVTTQVGGSDRERRLNEQVKVSGFIGVRSSSMTAPAGRVDYYATIRNNGPRQVRLDALTIRQAGLTIRALGLPSEVWVQSGDSAQVPLSVRLDCNRHPGGRTSDLLRGQVSVRSGSGNLHTVSSLLLARPVTLMADTVCTAGGHPTGELSGPVSG